MVIRGFSDDAGSWKTIATFRRIGVPVTISGQQVNPGELIHADLNGVLVVPMDVADRLVAAVDNVRVRERRIMDFINSPEFTVEGMRDIFAH